MNWLMLLVGLMIGFLIYLMIDYLFWRDKRIYVQDAGSAELGELKGTNQRLEAEVGRLEADLAAQSLDLKQCQDRVVDFGSYEAEFEKKGWSLPTFFSGLFASRAWSDSSDADGGRFFARFDEQDQRIADLEAQVAGGSGEVTLVDGNVDVELAELRSKVATYEEADAQFRARGGSLAGFLGGWFGSNAWNRMNEDEDTEFDLEGLFARIDGLEADVDAKDARIAELEANAVSADVDVDVEDMRTRLAVYEEAEAKFGAKGGSLTGFLGGWFGSSAWNRMNEDEDTEFDLEGLFARIDGLEADVDAKDARIGELEAQLAAGSADVNVDVEDMRTRLAVYEEAEAKFGAKGGSLTGFLGGWFGSSAWNRMNEDEDTEFDLEGLFARIDGLEADVNAKDARIVALEGELAAAQLDPEVENRLAAYEEADARFRARGGSLTGFLGGWFGSRAWSRYNDAEETEFDLEGLFTRIDGLEGEVDAKDAEIADLKLQLANVDMGDGPGFGAGVLSGGAAAAVATGFAASGTAFESEEDEDDLSIIWGIGPKIEGLLKGAGIRTYRDLADAEPAAISDTLDEAGSQYRLSSDELQDSWREQAALAAEGRWDELDQVKAELAAARKNSDSLRHIWGVGSTAEGMFSDLGIGSLADLRGASRDKLSGLLSYLRPFYGNASEDEIYASVQEQAGLAADGRWVSLRRFQMPFRQSRTSDDLTEIWGVGRGSAEQLNSLGIQSFGQLAQSSQAEIEAPLTDIKTWYGPNATSEKVHASMVEQAGFASIGDWEALGLIQDRLRAAQADDDLKKLWGIGPKVEEALKGGGISSFVALADTSVENITAILESSGSRFTLSVNDVKQSWLAQAALAAEGRWEDLKALQSKLKWKDLDNDLSNND